LATRALRRPFLPEPPRITRFEPPSTTTLTARHTGDLVAPLVERQTEPLRKEPRQPSSQRAQLLAPCEAEEAVHAAQMTPETQPIGDPVIQPKTFECAIMDGMLDCRTGK
jgi:hypothetical protein